jgi:hypothetical protein
MISMKRVGLKLFSLCVLALGLVAFSATAAQGAVWMVNKADLTAGTKSLNMTLDENHGILLAKLGLNEVEFLCTKGELLNAKLEPEGAVSEASKNAKADFSGCITKVNKVEAKACQPKATGKVAGTIETEEFYGLLKLHPDTNEGVVLITPKTGTLLAVIHMGEACSIGEAVSVSGGCLTLHDVGVGLNADELAVERLNHLGAEFKALTTLKAFNSKSESAATLDGMADFTLVSGETWSGLKQ